MRVRSCGLVRQGDRSATPVMVGRSEDEDVIAGCIRRPLIRYRVRNGRHGSPMALANRDALELRVLHHWDFLSISSQVATERIR